MIKKYFFVLLIITFSASGMFPIIDDSLLFFEGFPFDIEPNVGESVGSRSASLTYEVDNNLYGLFGGEREMAFNGESDDQVYYENIDDFCQAVDLPRCRIVMAECLFLIMTRPVTQWLLQEQEKIKLESAIESQMQRSLFIDNVNTLCLKLLVAVIKNDKDRITEYLETLPLVYSGKVIMHVALLMYYLSSDISISELLLKLNTLKIAINHHFFLTKFINYLLRVTKNLLLIFQMQGPDIAQNLLKNYMKNCDQYLIYLPILEQYQVRMEKILAR